MLLAFAAISYLSIPGAMGITPENAYSILIQRLLASTILLLFVGYYSNREFLRSILNVNPATTQWLIIVIVLSMFLIPVIYAQNNFDERRMAIFRISWTYSLIAVYFINTCIYYLLYEITLRGFFLNWLKKNYSTPIAVSFNVLVYAYMHLPKGPMEAVACIPFGLLLCIATIRTRSILPAMLMHVVLGISLESSMIYHINVHL